MTVLHNEFKDETKNLKLNEIKIFGLEKSPTSISNNGVQVPNFVYSNQVNKKI